MPSKTGHTHTHTHKDIDTHAKRSSKENYMLPNIFYKTYLIIFSLQRDASYIRQWLPKTDTIKKPIMRSNLPQVNSFWIPVIFLEVRWSSYYPWAGWSTCLWSCDEMLNESKWGPARHDRRNSWWILIEKVRGERPVTPTLCSSKDSDGQPLTSVTSLHVH